MDHLTNAVHITVAVALPVMETYTYAVPPALLPEILPGKRVLVPFGRRRVTGYILGPSIKEPIQSIKDIIAVLDRKPLFSNSLGDFFQWIADYYFHPIGQVIHCALPTGLTYNDTPMVALAAEGKQCPAQSPLSPLERDVIAALRKGPRRLKELNTHFQGRINRSFLQALSEKNLVIIENAFSGNFVKPKLERWINLLRPNFCEDSSGETRKQVMSVLKHKGPMTVSALKALVPKAPHVLNPLAASGYIQITRERTYRDPFGDPILTDTPPCLTLEQNQVIGEITGALHKGFAAYLLTGVTGSGKTEVYMQLAAQTLQRGYSVLVLVPEIALISQVERRFRARFGEQVGILHSGLSKGERFDQWTRIAENKTPIVIGTRSAVFAPLDNIGLIVVDEEHDTSYKQDNGLTYNGRDLAVKRASFANCVAVLGSATPSVQSYYNVLTEKYKQVSLTQRIEMRPLSEIHIVDLRKHRGMRGVRKYITLPLIQAMQDALERKEQVLLFINRRGYSNMSVCGACGRPIKCRNCDITMTLHHKINTHQCHYCGYSQASVPHCPVCGSEFIQHLGMGTEKIEMAVSKLFPNARIARMDRDTTRRKGSLLKILKDLKKNTIDILIGTQMVAKGHDFPNITLVGVICADLSLNFPDFRSGARTFQLLAQVAGRAGRGEAPGRVILQTYNPDHFSIAAAKTQDFRVFYNQDIVFRKALLYPPFSRLIMFKISGKDKNDTGVHACLLGKVLSATLMKSPFSQSISILGPIASAIPKIAGQYRWQLILKGRHVKPLHQFMKQFIITHKKLFRHSTVKVAIDVDPIFMM